MLVPLSWLKDYVDIDVTPDELENKLFSCGFEVEEKYEVGKDISKVVVGEVKTCEAIEGTHLHLCTVDAGENGVLQICCGADNVAAGGKYPLALIGAQVYATAKVTSANGNWVNFEVAAFDEKGEIGNGVHTRYIIDAQKFMAKLTK